MTQLQDKTLILNVGPHHSAAVGPLRIRLETDGEMVLGGQPEVGYLHRGIEKIGERLTWTGFMPFTDRVDYLASIHCNLAYALAVEKLARVDVSDRASAIRVIAGELNRIASHLLSFGSIAVQLGSETAMAYVLRDRERLNNLFEMLCGARLTYSYIRVGGVAADVTEGFIEKTYEFLDYLMPRMKEYNDLLSNNGIFTGRLENVGPITASQAVACGVSGPILRAGGMKQDMRKVYPYCSYHKYDFDIPVGRGEAGCLGDAFDRHMVRMREVEQSMSLIRQALDSLPEGEFMTPLLRDFKPPKGEAYTAVESPRGTLGVYVNSFGEKYPYRVRFRTPSFAVLNLFPDVLRNVSLSDVPTLVGSLDIMVSEVDR